MKYAVENRALGFQKSFRAQKLYAVQTLWEDPGFDSLLQEYRTAPPAFVQAECLQKRLYPFHVTCNSFRKR